MCVRLSKGMKKYRINSPLYMYYCRAQGRILRVGWQNIGNNVHATRWYLSPLEVRNFGFLKQVLCNLVHIFDEFGLRLITIICMLYNTMPFFCFFFSLPKSVWANASPLRWALNCGSSYIKVIGIIC